MLGNMMSVSLAIALGGNALTGRITTALMKTDSTMEPTMVGVMMVVVASRRVCFGSEYLDLGVCVYRSQCMNTRICRLQVSQERT